MIGMVLCPEKTVTVVPEQFRVRGLSLLGGHVGGGTNSFARYSHLCVKGSLRGRLKKLATFLARPTATQGQCNIVLSLSLLPQIGISWVPLLVKERGEAI